MSTKISKAIIEHWMSGNNHLPTFMRDFHDQKDVFKSVGGMVCDLTPNVSWIQGHCYVIDKFLRFMAQHGYTLQRTRTKIDFLDLGNTIAERRQSEDDLLGPR